MHPELRRLAGEILSAATAYHCTALDVIEGHAPYHDLISARDALTDAFIAHFEYADSQPGTQLAFQKSCRDG
jgi:hypothetical protein